MTWNNQIEITIFTNTRRTNPKAPSETGTVEFPDGTKYQVALWERVSKKGTPFKTGTLTLDDGSNKYGSGRSNESSDTPTTPTGGVKVDF